MHITEDRVLENTTSTGSTVFALTGAVAGHTTLAVARRADGTPIQVGDTLFGVMIGVDGATTGNATGVYESAQYTYTAAAQVTRTATFSSSNANAAVTWGAGAKWFAVAAVASKVLQLNNELTANLPAVTVAAVSASATDTMSVFARKVAGRMMLKVIGPSGVDNSIQDRISENSSCFYLPNTGTTIGLNLGIGWTTGGTISHPTPSSTAPAIYSQMRRTRWANVVTTQNQTLGLHTVTALKTFWRGNAAGLGGFLFHARFAIGLWPAATVRLFVGLSNQNTSPVASDTLAGNCCGFWHDTTEAATVMTFVTRDNTTTTKISIGALPAALAAGQAYECWIWSAPNGSVIGYKLAHINSGTVVVDTTTSTTIPLNTAFMGPTLQMSNGTANTTVTTTAMEVMAVSCQSDI